MIKVQRPHPDHEWLLLMSDGELPPEARAAMQKHLEACWECRHELQQIESAIGDAVRYRQEVLVRHLPPPPESWRDLSSGFAAIDREMAPPGLLSRIGAVLGMPRYAIPLAAAVLGAAVSTMILVERSPEAAAVKTASVGEQQPGNGVKSSGLMTQAPGAVGLAPTVPSNSAPEPIAVATPAELAHSAVVVAQLLHKMGADLGEPIEILRTAARVVVRGVGLDASRAHELEPLVKQVPFVDFQLSSTGVNREETTLARFAGPAGDAPFQNQLEQALGGRAAVDAMASDSLDRADAMMMRAHALRRLDEQFSNENDTLSSDDNRAVQAIRRELAASLVTEIARLERMLTPVVKGLGAVAGPGTVEAPNPVTVLAAARRLEGSIAELTGAKLPGGPVEQLPNRLATDLASASQLAKALAALN